MKKKSALKLSMVAAAISLSLLAAPAQAGQVSRDTGVGRLIAAQGNAALRMIRAEMKAELRALRPALPSAHTTKVSVPASAGGASASAGARCAK